MNSTQEKLKALGIEATEQITFTVEGEEQTREAYNILKEDGWTIIEYQRDIVDTIMGLCPMSTGSYRAER